MSEKSLDQLIDSIKNEGIAAAEKKSAELIEEARAEAERIVKIAEDRRDDIISKAKEEAKAMVSKGESAFQQAGRDYSISVRNDILKLFQGVFEKEVKSDFTVDVVKTAILNVVNNVGSQVEVSVNPSQARELADYIHSKIDSGEVPKILEDQDLLSGFAVSQKDEGWYFQISPEEVATALQDYLNPYWVEILNKEMS